MEPLYFVHLSDSHIGPTADYARHGQVALPCSQKAVALINQLPTRPDFVIHTGDVVTNPSTAAYQMAAETFARLEVPVYYVVGNHDRAQDIRRFLPMGEREPLSDNPDLLTYAFEVKGYRFVVVDGRAVDSLDPHGYFSDEQLEIMRRESRPEGPPLTFFGHFPLLPLNAPWMDGNMRVLNWMAGHLAMLPAGNRLRGYFHGHVHQNMQTTRDGLLYVSVASLFAQFMAWPADDDVRVDEQHPPGYNFVHLLPNQTIIHQHTFSR